MAWLRADGALINLRNARSLRMVKQLDGASTLVIHFERTTAVVNQIYEPDKVLDAIMNNLDPDENCVDIRKKEKHENHY